MFRRIRDFPSSLVGLGFFLARCLRVGAWRGDAFGRTFDTEGLG